VTLTICDFVLVLNTFVRKSSDLPEFNQTHNTTIFSLGLPDHLKLFQEHFVVV